MDAKILRAIGAILLIAVRHIKDQNHLQMDVGAKILPAVLRHALPTKFKKVLQRDVRVKMYHVIQQIFLTAAKHIKERNHLKMAVDARIFHARMCALPTKPIKVQGTDADAKIFRARTNVPHTKLENLRQTGVLAKIFRARPNVPRTKPKTLRQTDVDA